MQTRPCHGIIIRFLHITRRPSSPIGFTTGRLHAASLCHEGATYCICVHADPRPLGSVPNLAFHLCISASALQLCWLLLFFLHLSVLYADHRRPWEDIKQGVLAYGICCEKWKPELPSPDWVCRASDQNAQSTLHDCTSLLL